MAGRPEQVKRSSGKPEFPGNYVPARFMIPMKVTPNVGRIIEMFPTLTIVPALNLVVLETR